MSTNAQPPPTRSGPSAYLVSFNDDISAADGQSNLPLGAQTIAINGSVDYIMLNTVASSLEIH